MCLHEERDTKHESMPSPIQHHPRIRASRSPVPRYLCRNPGIFDVGIAHVTAQLEQGPGAVNLGFVIEVLPTKKGCAVVTGRDYDATSPA